MIQQQEERAVRCESCNHSIASELEIRVGRTGEGGSYCPYCLTAAAPGARSASEHLSVERLNRRRETREKFVDELLRSSADGRLYCPVCERLLNKNDEIILRNSKYFRCHDCGQNLAALAYRRLVYTDRLWLPVIAVLGDQLRAEQCQRCALAGAIATACRDALAQIPESRCGEHGMLNKLLARTEWVAPDSDCVSSCLAVTKYRDCAGEALLLL
ncbi:hypothetical protein ACFL59_04695 [Planctomycetota bacterium]